MKSYFAVLAFPFLLISCANDEIVTPPDQVPIAFSTQRQNVTRASNLQDNGHYNFGVWARKIADEATTQTVMENYLVGFGGNKVGYEHSNGTTWADNAGNTSDHRSPWFYEGLGKSQYTYSGSDGYYKAEQSRYMSAKDYQYLRYWDLAYTHTNFFCYTPYRSEGVTCTLNDDGSAVMTFTGTTVKDHYDNPINSSYNGEGTDPSLTEFMYAGVQATNSSLSDIIVPFKHMGAQVFIRFYEEIPGYKVELLDLSADGGTMKEGTSSDQKFGIQATPSKKSGDTYTKDVYYTTSGATISFSTSAVASFTGSTSGASSTQQNLMFAVPGASGITYPTINVPTDFMANLANFDGLSSTVHKTIPEKVTTGGQTYSWSPTVYYPVAQPATQKTGFTFHVTYRIIAEDNKEVITVHNATVFVPSDYTTWTANTRYIYTFRITRNSSGSTSPSKEIDPTDPSVDTESALYPIVFDGCTVDDYTESSHESTIGMPEGSTSNND